ncbi:hypothetical protein ES703_06743 [subsurface metagenome]
MKDYNTILSRVQHLLKCYSPDYVKGYIYALVDWWVVSTKTFERLEDFIKKEEKKK